MSYPDHFTSQGLQVAHLYSRASWSVISDFVVGLNQIGKRQQQLCEHTLAVLDSAHAMARWISPAADTCRWQLDQMYRAADETRSALNRAQRHTDDHMLSIQRLAREIRHQLDEHQHQTIRKEQLQNQTSERILSSTTAETAKVANHLAEIEHSIGRLSNQIEGHLTTVTRLLHETVRALAELEPAAALSQPSHQLGRRESRTPLPPGTAGDITAVLLALRTYRHLPLPAQTPRSTRDILAKLSPSQRFLFSQVCPAATSQLCCYERSESQLFSDLYSDPTLHRFAARLQQAEIHTLQPSPQDTLTQVTQVEQAWSEIDSQTRSYLIHAYPSVVGRLRGIPPDARFRANRLALQGYRWSLTTQKAAGQNEDTGLEVVNPPAKLAVVDSLLVESFHENPGSGARQILHFDPRGTGKLIEVIGTLDEHTTRLGVLVPGTGAQLTTHENYAASSRYFLHAGDPDYMAQIVFSDGLYPQDIFSARERDAAHTTGRLLAGQMVELGHFCPAAKLTVAGYSYGGAIVGVSETYGMPADHVIHLSSAGMGTTRTRGESAIASPQDYPERDLLGRNKHETTRASGTTRWTHTPASDPISLAQELSDFVPGVGHGVDPEDFPGIRILSPGRYLPGYSDPEKVGQYLGADVLDVKSGVEAHQDVHKPFTETARAVGQIAFGQQLPASRRVPAVGTARTLAQVAKEAAYVQPGLLIRR